ncbi:hypothetical protein [Streptomyces azureus]|uniref:Uncharacterized protein n=1 Tax=Streptomyces azureus TaxID=146537 RepID=A0A0K8PLJ0_STRAJ|nr:hypothetical protein [Streptomyces azureus]GAP48747.1 uncharacterized protein SAZU_3583 [Streptomyces azureus]
MPSRRAGGIAGWPGLLPSAPLAERDEGTGEVDRVGQPAVADRTGGGQRRRPGPAAGIDHPFAEGRGRHLRRGLPARPYSGGDQWWNSSAPALNMAPIVAC